jgi:hypothetical protein
VRDFPFEACRDLLGLLRAVFAAEKRRSFPKPRKLKTLERLARELQDAVTLAATHDPGTLPYEKAMGMADGVARRLGDVVELTDPVMPILEAAGKRVRPKKQAAERASWASERRRKGGG